MAVAMFPHIGPLCRASRRERQCTLTIIYHLLPEKFTIHLLQTVFKAIQPFRQTLPATALNRKDEN